MTKRTVQTMPILKTKLIRGTNQLSRLQLTRVWRKSTQYVESKRNVNTHSEIISFGCVWRKHRFAWHGNSYTLHKYMNINNSLEVHSGLNRQSIKNYILPEIWYFVALEVWHEIAEEVSMSIK